jgi:RNA polymerase sigma-70 factor (ECF subfamily)
MSDAVHDIVIAELPRHLTRLWRYALLLSRDRTMAEDLVQATCVRALERSAQFTPGTRIDRWLIAILRSIWINEMRAARVRAGQGTVDADEILATDGPERTITNMLAAQVLTEVQALPEAQRETVMLVYVEGFTYREAAETLGIPIGTVMSRLAGARRKLGSLKDAEDRPEPQGSTEETR